MKKIVKIAVIAVVVILAIALIAPAALRGKIADIVKREANAMLAARLDFEKLDISLLRHFPNASVELKGLTLVGVDRFEGDTIVAARRISVVVNLMSLFGDSGFEVTKVILASPAVHAHKLADGAVSWDVMKPSEAPAEEVPAEEPAPSSFRLSVRDFRISDAAIRYEDDSTNMRFSTAPLSLRLRGNMSADRTDLDLRLTAAAMRFVSGGIPLLSDAEAELVAVIDADLANNRFTFSRNTLRLNAISVGLDGWVELDGDAVAMDLKAGCDKVQFKDVLSLVPAFYTRDFRNLAAGGELSMALWARGEMRGAALPALPGAQRARQALPVPPFPALGAGSAVGARQAPAPYGGEPAAAAAAVRRAASASGPGGAVHAAARDGDARSAVPPGAPDAAVPGARGAAPPDVPDAAGPGARSAVPPDVPDAAGPDVRGAAPPAVPDGGGPAARLPNAAGGTNPARRGTAHQSS